MNGAPEPQTAAHAAPLVGPYPIDEEALRKLKRLHDDGVIDDYTFRCRKAEALGLTRKVARARTRLSLLHLPADMLSKIASHSVAPALVVAAEADVTSILSILRVRLGVVRPNTAAREKTRATRVGRYSEDYIAIAASSSRSAARSASSCFAGAAGGCVGTAGIESGASGRGATGIGGASNN